MCKQMTYKKCVAKRCEHCRKFDYSTMVQPDIQYRCEITGEVLKLTTCPKEGDEK